MNKILKEIIQLVAAVIMAFTLTCVIFGSEVFTERTIILNFEDSYHVISLYAVVVALAISILSPFSFARATLRKFDNTLLNCAALFYNCVLLLLLPMLFGLYVLISNNSVGDLNTIYLCLQIGYVVVILMTVYMAFQIGRKSAMKVLDSRAEI